MAKNIGMMNEQAQFRQNVLKQLLFNKQRAELQKTPTSYNDVKRQIAQKYIQDPASVSEEEKEILGISSKKVKTDTPTNRMKVWELAGTMFEQDHPKNEYDLEQKVPTKQEREVYLKKAHDVLFQGNQDEPEEKYKISLPDSIEDTQSALDHLKKTYGMADEEAIQWLRDDQDEQLKKSIIEE
jgi:hypothetical protein